MQDVFLNTYAFTTQVTRSGHILKRFDLIIVIKRAIIMVITACYQTSSIFYTIVYIPTWSFTRIYMIV